jgi:hypothetical protein
MSDRGCGRRWMYLPVRLGLHLPQPSLQGYDEDVFEGFLYGGGCNE